MTTVDLRSDTLTRPTAAMRRGDGRRRGRRRRLRRGPDGPRARGAAGGALRPRGGAVHPDRLDGQRARRAHPRRPRPGGALRGTRPHRPRRARRPRGVHRPHDAHLAAPARRRRPAGRSRRCSPPTWGRSSCRPRRSRSRTPTTSPGERCCRSRTCARSGRTPTTVGVRIHLDGARIWNAHVATGVPLAEYGAVADVLAVCLSKGLGAPIGSAVVGGADAIAESRVWRKRMGGGMRQVGILAAAGLHALDHHVERLADDHAHARLLAEAPAPTPPRVDTNIVVVDRPDAAAYVAAARGRGVLIATVGPTAVRMVTHLDVDARRRRARGRGSSPASEPGRTTAALRCHQVTPQRGCRQSGLSLLGRLCQPPWPCWPLVRRAGPAADSAAAAALLGPCCRPGPAAPGPARGTGRPAGRTGHPAAAVPSRPAARAAAPCCALAALLTAAGRPAGPAAGRSPAAGSR